MSDKKNITEQEYLAARKVVDAYEKQMQNKKMSIYEGCTEKNLISNEINTNRAKTTYFWVSLDGKIPDRNPEGYIAYDHACEFYTLEHGRVPYNTYDKAYKALIKAFKRKGFIK